MNTNNNITIAFKVFTPFDVFCLTIPRQVGDRFESLCIAALDLSLLVILN